MGVYLSKPKTEKTSANGSSRGRLCYGVTSMQGWRKNMEDAHLASPDISGQPVELYGVFDGHGGCAVSAWVSRHFVDEFVTNFEELKNVANGLGSPNMDDPVDTAADQSGDVDTEKTSQSRPVKAVPSPPEDDDDDEDTVPREDSDDKLIHPQPEPSVSASTLPEEIVLTCEALQLTFLRLDEKMKTPESRSQLKQIHESLTSKTDEEDNAAELNSMLKMYLNISNRGNRGMKVAENTDGQKRWTLLSGNRRGFVWTDEEEDGWEGGEDGDSGRIEDVTDDGSEECEQNMTEVFLENAEKDGDSDMNRSSDNAPSDKRAEEYFASAPAAPAGSDSSVPTNLNSCQTDCLASHVSDNHPASPMETASSSDASSYRLCGYQEAYSKKTQYDGVFEVDSPNAAEHLSEESSSSSHHDDAEATDTSTNAGQETEGESDANMEPMAVLAPYEPEHCGTTAVCLAVLRMGKKPFLIAANAGDSRVVVSRGGEAIALSCDHKPNLITETKRIRAAGGTVMQGRVDGNLNLSRALGDLIYKDDEALPAEAQRITSFPDVRVLPLESDMEFAVLACDGIWDCLSNQEVVDFVRRRLFESTHTDRDLNFKPDTSVLSQICEEICDKCLAENPLTSEGIGCDNMTIMIVLLNPLGTLRSNTAPQLYSGHLYRRCVHRSTYGA